MSQKDIRAVMFGRARAAKALVSSIRNQETADKVELAAFMDIFHPEKSDEKNKADRNRGRKPRPDRA